MRVWIYLLLAVKPLALAVKKNGVGESQPAGEIFFTIYFTP